MAKAYQEGGFEGLKKTYSAIKPDYTKYGFNMENLLYKDFDGWIVKNKKSNEEYIGYLEFMRDELPNSVNVLMDLGSWMETRNIEEAKNCYNKCLELNPAHHYAKMKLGLMELNPPTKSK